MNDIQPPAWADIQPPKWARRLAAVFVGFFLAAASVAAVLGLVWLARAAL